MYTTEQLKQAADELEEIARALFAIDRDATGRASEQPTRVLARSVAYWMIVLRRLADSGADAWTALDAGFPRDEDEDPAPASPKRAEGPAEMVGELDAMSAFIFGDLVLEDLAYAELVRRGAVPAWEPGGWLPSMWNAFVRLNDETPDPTMAADVRSLDLTLAPARDALVAHRDPTLYSLPSFASWGEVRLTRVTFDDDRKRAAEDDLRAANATLERPWPVWSNYDRMLDTLVALAGHLSPDGRSAIKRAYGKAGFESPPLGGIVERTIRLLRRHLQALQAMVAEDSAAGE